MLCDGVNVTVVPVPSEDSSLEDEPSVKLNVPGTAMPPSLAICMVELFTVEGSIVLENVMDIELFVSTSAVSWGGYTEGALIGGRLLLSLPLQFEIKTDMNNTAAVQGTLKQYLPIIDDPPAGGFGRSARPPIEIYIGKI
jgi:hypothetical protein